MGKSSAATRRCASIHSSRFGHCESVITANNSAIPISRIVFAMMGKGTRVERPRKLVMHITVGIQYAHHAKSSFDHAVVGFGLVAVDRSQVLWPDLFLVGRLNACE